MSRRGDRRREREHDEPLTPAEWFVAVAEERGIPPETWEPYSLLDRDRGDPYADDAYLVPDPYTSKDAWDPPHTYPPGESDRYGAQRVGRGGALIYDTANPARAWVRADDGASRVLKQDAE